MAPLSHDFRFALRQIRRAPAFAFFVVAMLAIGIGANTTIFSAVNALMFRPLPYVESDRLVNLSGRYVGRGQDWSVSLPNAEDWRRLNRTFEEMAYTRGASFSLAGRERPERVNALLGSASLFSMLRVSPLLGRGYTEEEAAPGGERVVLLSHALWQRRFAGDPGVPGTVVTLSGNQYTVIGVMPEGFSYPSPDIDLWAPIRADETTWNRANGGLFVVGRLRRGVTLEQARADMDAVSATLAAEYPGPNAELSAGLKSLREAMYGGRELPIVMFTLLGAVSFVLLIACVNVANLLIARATSREREVAVRAAIGAGRTHVLRQMLTESLVLAVLGGGLGLLLAVWGTAALPAVIPEDAPIPRDLGIDGAVLAFTAVLTVATGLVFGMAPALQASRADLSQLLGGRSGRMTRRRVRRRNLLVMAEVALATVLLVSAGLTIRSLTGLLSRDPGFDPTNVLTMRVALDATYERNEQVVAFLDRVTDRMAAVPGVESAGVVDFIPLGGTNNYGDFFIDGGATDRSENAGTVLVTPGYLETMGIRLVEGRTLEAADGADAPAAVVVNRALAERYWPDGNALGSRLRLGFDRNGDEPRWRTVVGVVDDVRHSGLDEDARREMYIPFAQLPWTPTYLTFVARTSLEPLALVNELQQSIWDVDPNQAVFETRTMERLVQESGAVLISRILAGALAVFGMVALLLAALGLYGVLSYSVAQRTYEIGIRSALGADRGRVLHMVLRQGMSVVLIGLGVGLLGALAATRVMSGVLFGVSARDPLSFAVSAATLAAVALLATWVPAHRATRVDPLTALRTE